MSKLLILVFLFVCFNAILSFELKRLPWRENVCDYNEEIVGYRMKRRFSRQCSHEFKNCDNPLFPNLRCLELRCEMNIKRVPQTYVRLQHKYDCCPGWSSESKNRDELFIYGCLNHTSCITLPQFTPAPCHERRKVMLFNNRQTYSLTTPPKNVPEKIPEANVTAANLRQFLTFPMLNLTQLQVVGLTLANPNERTWAKVYIDMSKRNNRIANETLQPGNFKFFKSVSDYADLLDFYRKRQLTGGPFDQYFKYPSQEEDFKDIIKSDIWQDDKVFVEQRLAGLNPMSLRKLYLKEYNKIRSLYSSKFDDAIQKVTRNTNRNMSELVKEGAVYVLDYPLIRDLTNVGDILDLNRTDRREMRTSRSPFCVFVSLKNYSTGKYELKPLAIQTDFKKSAPFYTPSDGRKWMLAKEEVQRADVTHAEIIEHLLKTHLMMEPICVSLQRTLSVFHPLYEVLKWHCRGTFMTNSLGLPSLVMPHGIMHNMFSIGHVGSIELLNKGYYQVSWEDTDFEQSLKKRGVYDKEKLPYFPYRDDGIIIWRLLRAFANEYVDLYYKNKYFVRKDEELQNFVNELSDNGKKPNGGKGMLKKFPSGIWTKAQLKDILVRMIFVPLQHHAVNYPIAYYGAFVPNMPWKLYDDPRAPPEEFSIYNLPQSHIATLQVSLSMTLGSLRYDKLLDYASQMGDKQAADVVQKYYKILMGPIQKQLRKRNKERLRDGHMTYPYFLPGWIPNSIHT